MENGVAILLRLSFIAVAYLSSEVEGFQCYTCASNELYQDWQITGFPKKLSREAFVPTACDDPQNWPPGTTSPISFDCQSACVALLIQTTTEETVSRNLWVRGCVDKLLGYDPKLQSDFCQTGTIKRFNSANDGKDTSAQLQYCKTDFCNSENKLLSSASCNSGSNAQQRTCAECTAYDDNCNGPDTCSGNWCTKVEGHLGKTKIITKGCSPFNLYSAETTGNNCQNIHSTQFISAIVNRGREKRGVLIPYDGTQCYCNDKEHCNGAMKSHSLNLLLTVFSLVIAIVVSRNA